jgi:leucyl aminopeptidase (aminopeptidase T)
MIVMEAREAARNALECVFEAKKDESLAIFCDDEKIDVGKAFTTGALKLGLKTHLVPLKTEPNVFRTQYPKEVTDIITNNPPDIYINLMRGIREETPFRIQLTKMETKDRKVRLGHCPGVTIDMLTNGALALTTQEHRKMQTFANTLIKKLSNPIGIEISTPAGSKLSLSTKDRPFFTDTIIDWKTMNWMNLPTGEVIAGPVEDSLEGTLVCDMAIGGIGPIKSPVKITVKNGKVQTVSCQDNQVLKRVKESLGTDDWSDVVGEFAFGINPKARFVEEFLESEKMLGTVHIAFGANMDFPNGKNPSKNHLDLMMGKPTVRFSNDHSQNVPALVDGIFKDV